MPIAPMPVESYDAVSMETHEPGLHSRYIKHRSPKIQETMQELENKPDGTYGYSGFRQREDMKLSYAFNPYNITFDTVGEQRKVTLWYDFDWPRSRRCLPNIHRCWTDDGQTRTTASYTSFPDCPTYRVEQSWYIKN